MAKKKKRLDDYIEKRVRDHDDPDKVADMTFKSVRKGAVLRREMPVYNSAEESNEGSEHQEADEEERSKEEE